NKVVCHFASSSVILSEAKNLSFKVERDPSLRLRMTDRSVSAYYKKTSFTDSFVSFVDSLPIF
ncbi:MAG TPA: hypothetical protein VKE41_23470, partial [Roseiflexaceae bacterium]|nr:hypothetical protein [Roseiflexaceae bacterium]